MTAAGVSFTVPAIPHIRLVFDLRAREEARLPAFLGSTLRGGLAQALKRIACVARRVHDCRDCAFVHACVYAHLFETPRPRWAERYPTLESVPRPIVIEPPVRTSALQAGDTISFAVRLVGRAVDHWAHVVIAVQRMAEAGLGKGRARFALECARDADSEGTVLFDGHDLVPHASVTVLEGVENGQAPSRRVQINFLTPTRLVEGGQLLRRPTLPAVVRSIAFRAATVSYFHAGLDWDPTPVTQAAGGDVREVESDIAWTPLQRFSTRQDQKVPLDGFTGRIVYEGDAVAALLPLLRLGEVLHVGKGTVFGLGRVVVHARDG